MSAAEKRHDFDNFFMHTVNPKQNSFPGFYYTCFKKQLKIF